MSENFVHISVGGLKYSGWTSVSINKSLETLSNSFELVVVDKTNQKTNADWLLRTQKECVIYIGTDKLITGYIDKVDADVSFDSHNIKVSGRDKTADLVDCSYTESGKSFSRKTMLTLAKTLVQPFGIGVNVSPGTDVSDSFQFTVNSNDSIFKNLNKKANDFGLLLLTDSDGNLLISNSGSTKVAGSLEYGKNIKSAKVMFDYTNRFSEYIVQAQSLPKQHKGSWSTNISIKATANDTAVLRNRPKLIKSSSPLAATGAQQAANWEALIRAAKSQTVQVTVQGFRDSDDVLWDVNKLVDVVIPPLYINPITEMLITSVKFSLNSEGTFTTLTLKRKDAYAAKPNRSKNVKGLASLGWDKLGP